MSDKLKPEALEYFKPPFKYEPAGQTIYCEGSHGNMMCLQVRGWGALIGTGSAYALPHDKAAVIQDEFGEWVAEMLNLGMVKLLKEAHPPIMISDSFRANLHPDTLQFLQEKKEA